MSPTRQLQAPSVSVIVPVWNGADTLGSCLTALSKQTWAAHDYEILVVNDGSTDGSATIAAEFEVTLLHQEHKGAAAARNRGAQAAEGQVLLFTDADCEPTVDWIAQMLKAFASPEVVGVKGVYRTRQRSLVARFTQAEYAEKYGRLARQRYIDFVDTYAAAYRRGVFVQYGGFDPEFLLDEDQEFSYRLAQEGLKMVLAPQAVVYHRHSPTLSQYLKRKVNLGRWKIRVLNLYPGKAIRDSYTPWTQKAQIVLVWPAALAFLLSLAGLWPWWPTWALAGLGLLSTLPLVFHSAGQSMPVAAAAPFLAALRALALSAGLAIGLAGFLRNRIK